MKALPSTFTISLDFELYWGVRDKRSLDSYRANLLGVREAVPRTLDLFAEYGIHATWATVGFLFFDGRDDLAANLPPVRPHYRRAALSPYPAIDGVGTSEKDDPFHFAPSLIRRIASCDGQEIGTHTFSHYYCLEEGDTPAAFRADLEAAVAAGARVGRKPRSIVFPRNQVREDYLPICSELGIVAYRGTERAWMYRAAAQAEQSRIRRAARLLDTYVPITADGTREPRNGDGSVPVNVPSSRFLRPYSRRLRTLEPLKLRRITGEMRRAAKSGRMVHLWWHPHNFGVNTAENLATLRRILDCYRELAAQHGMRSLNMAEAAEQLR